AADDATECQKAVERLLQLLLALRLDGETDGARNLQGTRDRETLERRPALLQRAFRALEQCVGDLGVEPGLDDHDMRFLGSHENPLRKHPMEWPAGPRP